MQGKTGSSRRVALLTAASVCVWALVAGSASAAAPPTPPVIVKAQVVEVTATTATLEAMINPEGSETSYQFRFGASDCSLTNCSRIPKTKEAIGAGKEPIVVAKALEGLEPGTIYHFLVEAQSPEGTVKSTDHAFATLGEPSEGLPDGRAYEQATPVNKDGGDAIGTIGLVKAADDGNGITFNSTFGIPGGKGAQVLPTYLATRGTGEAGWSTQGLLPPPSFGQIARVQGWLPDFSETFGYGEKLGNPALGEQRTQAFFIQPTTGPPASTITPYTFKAEYSYVGTDADNSTVFFESQAKLPPEAGKEPIAEAIEGKSNLYAWDRASGRISLVDVSNLGKAPPGGGFAGPYDWSLGITSFSLTHGGAERGYYLQETNAITAAGDIYFTEAGTGRLFLRRNPTRPQSKMAGEECLEEEAACTIAVSDSKRTVPDPAGPQPAAFQAATEDGSEVFFTSPQKLTNDANTGPEQPEAAIVQASSATGVVEKEKLIPKHAIGVTVDATHVYWADPTTGTIDRADLNGESIVKPFVSIPESECEVEVETKPGVFVKEKVKAPARPRYVAVSAKYIYWTNAGALDGEGNPVDGCGTIGRAELNGNEAKDVDAEFIRGASNPQGIAVNATHLYWANAAKDGNRGAIARANIEGEEAKEVKEEFFSPGSSLTPFGVALDGTYAYFTLDNAGSNLGQVGRIPLDGGPFVQFGVGEAGLRGMAVDGTYLYWASQREHRIGRIPSADFNVGGCSGIPTCNKEFAKNIEGSLNGLAVNSEHLYWSVNGETPINPGNDLYSFHPATGELEDLTADPSKVENGAEVQGLMGSSPDGSYLYLVANGDLDGTGPATRGNCRTPSAHGGLSTTSGACNLYVLHEGKAHLIGRVSGRDALDWTGSVLGIFAGAGSVPKASFLGQGGQALLFKSQAKLTGYENEGVAELYRYSATEETLSCVSCPPSGEAVERGPALASFDFPGSVGPPFKGVNPVASRNLSADGNHAFFETAEALVPGDTNGRESTKTCPAIGSLLTPACLDVYEWEAPGTNACKAAAPAYSPLNGGCIYLISTGKDKYPSLFADASESGEDVFFFTRQRLVGQDQDELQDVYDARVGGGLPAQNIVKPPPCASTEACHQPSPPAPVESTPATPGFFGPQNPKPKHKKPKAQKHKKKHKAKKHKQKRANAKGRTGR